MNAIMREESSMVPRAIVTSGRADPAVGRTATRRSASEGRVRVRRAIHVRVGQSRRTDHGHFAAEKAILLIGRFERATKFRLSTAALARDSAAFAVCSAGVGAIAARNLGEACGLALESSTLDPGVALVDRRAGLPGWLRRWG